MGIEKKFDIPFIADLALREKQIQQNYRPIIAVHKWFARRPGTLFRGLLLSEFLSSPLRDTYYCSQDLQGIKVADPFMGGGIPLLEANRLGCDVLGYDINPMAYWIVSQEMASLDLGSYKKAARALLATLETKIGRFYRTTCDICGSESASVKYFLWVKQKQCSQCDKAFDLFPGYLLAQNRRHPNNVVVCSGCGELNEAPDRYHLGSCHSCSKALELSGPAQRSRCICPHCGQENRYANSQHGPLNHRMFAIEYHCPECRPTHKGRFFKKPDTLDLDRFEEASTLFKDSPAKYIPEDHIPPGDETDRLHRWGYQRYSEMFNNRQLLGLGISAEMISSQEDQNIRHAFATNLSDLLRYQNLLCRYDTMALKSLDIFSVHGFPVGLIQCESNLLGIRGSRGTNVGSGGWGNIIDKFAKAKEYCDSPFETKHQSNQKKRIFLRGEWIGATRSNLYGDRERSIHLECKNSIEASIEPNSLDAVLTDPPYFGNVQYAELMDFCYVWLRKLLKDEDPAFVAETTRRKEELTGNQTMERGLSHFTEGLATTFTNMVKALKPGAPFAFTYHHNRLEAYFPVAVAILDSGLTCSASLPCPAEMGGSIHINGTGSSIVDTIFVCRTTGSVPRNWIAESAEDLSKLISGDLEQLRQAGLAPTRGDIRCISFGHLVRLTVWRLRKLWDPTKPVKDKLQIIDFESRQLATPADMERCLGSEHSSAPRVQRMQALEGPGIYEEGVVYDISF